MADKYHITAKEGDKRTYKPKLGGKEWTDHVMYGEPCTVIQSGAVYDVHQVKFANGKTEWARGDELT